MRSDGVSVRVDVESLEVAKEAVRFP